MKISEFKIKRDGTRVLVKGRLSYCHLDKPRAVREGDEPKYSVAVIVEDAETVKELQAAYKEAYELGVAKKWNGDRPNQRSKSFSDPLKEGDVEKPGDEHYAGKWYFNATSKTKVATLNRLKEAIPAEECYSGCYGIVSVNFFPFLAAQKGVAVGLNSVMKVADGERFGGVKDGSRDFDGLDFEEEEDSLDDL